MMRPIISWRAGLWRFGALVAAALALSACASSGAGDHIGAGAGQILPPADYLTRSDHFAELQRAALSADYEGFATHLEADNPQGVIAQLTDAFGGDPFDVYTLEAETGARGHARVAELRGPSGRLYLFFELDRADGGWNVDRFELGRDRETALARL